MSLRVEAPKRPKVGDVRRIYWGRSLIAIAYWDGDRWVAHL